MNHPCNRGFPTMKRKGCRVYPNKRMIQLRYLVAKWYHLLKPMLDNIILMQFYNKKVNQFLKSKQPGIIVLVLKYLMNFCGIKESMNHKLLAPAQKLLVNLRKGISPRVVLKHLNCMPKQDPIKNGIMGNV